MLRKKFVVALAITLLLVQIVPVDAQISEGDFSTTGPYVDKLRFEVITQDDQQVLALMENEVDIIGDDIYHVFIEELEEHEGIQIAENQRNGYGFFTINCAKYPFNITAFRRAFAFALDKYAISNDAWGGHASPQDSCIPEINPWSIEGQLEYDYYNASVDYGNYLLDQAGFLDIDNDSIREAPDGSDFEVRIGSATSTNVAIETGAIAVDAFENLGIDAESSAAWGGYDFIQRLVYHGDYDIGFIGASFSTMDVDWMAYEYSSEYADEPFWNLPNFRNTTYDSWIDQLTHSSEYNDVYEAASEMQKILIDESPIVICYSNSEYTACRNDRFEGFVIDTYDGLHSEWTYLNARLKSNLGGPSGGTLRITNPLDLNTFNIMKSHSAYTLNVLDEMYQSSIMQDPNGVDIPWLAESYTMETHQDNDQVPENRTRMTFNLVTNATWSDGTPITAEDAAATLNYYREAPGNPLGADMADVSAIYALNDQVLIVEFLFESIWHLHNIGYKPIMQKEFLTDLGLIYWNTWNPWPPEESMVTSGPFNISRYIPGEYVEMTKNANYFRIPAQPTTDSNITTTGNQTNPYDWLGEFLGSVGILNWVITIPSFTIIGIVAFDWYRKTRKE